jgi:hypothetical protein
MRKEKARYKPSDVDLKLRNTRVSFIRIGYTFNEDKMPVTELGAIFLEPLTQPSVQEEICHEYLLSRLSLQDSSALTYPSSTNLYETRDCFKRFSTNKSSFSQVKTTDQQNVIAMDCGGMSPQADHLYQQEASRLSSPMSNSSEEIITFCGRKRPETKTLNTISQSAYFAQRGRTPLGFIGSCNSLGVPQCESALHAPRGINSPCPHLLPINATSLMGVCKGKLPHNSKRGPSTSEKSNARNRNKKRHPRSSEALTDSTANLDETDNGNGSTVDSLSDVSNANSSDSGQQKFSSKEESDSATFIDFFEIENTHDHLTFSRKGFFLRAAEISSQVSRPVSIHEPIKIHMVIVLAECLCHP